MHNPLMLEQSPGGVVGVPAYAARVRARVVSSVVSLVRGLNEFTLDSLSAIVDTCAPGSSVFRKHLPGVHIYVSRLKVAFDDIPVA